MKQHPHIITLGVRDLDASRRFYSESLGCKPADASNDDITFMQAGGVVLALYAREKLAEDATRLSADGRLLAALACSRLCVPARKGDDIAAAEAGTAARKIRRQRQGFPKPQSLPRR